MTEPAPEAAAGCGGLGWAGHDGFSPMSCGGLGARKRAGFLHVDDGGWVDGSHRRAAPPNCGFATVLPQVAAGTSE